MQTLSQSIMCSHMQMKGLPPLHKPLINSKNTYRALSSSCSSSSFSLLSCYVSERPRCTELSAFCSMGALNILGPSFKRNGVFIKRNLNRANAYNPATATVGFSSADEEREREKLAQVSKRLESTARYFKRLGGLGFWSQLVCTVVAAVILAFSVLITGNATSPATFYLTAGGIVAAFLSVFWSFGYIRLAERLQRTASDPAKAPPRAEVVKTLKNGLIINILGMGSTVLGIQATVGVLVAKALTSSANPYYQGISSGYSPVLALDVFLVQACGNTLLSHFLGLVFSLELLRSVTLSQPPVTAIPKLA